jgi:hypothetical protein
MTEKIKIKEQEVWIVIDPLAVHRENHQTIPTEYFIASYYLKEPDNTPGERFNEADGKPRLFLSPVEALEHAYEVLAEVL